MLDEQAFTPWAIAGWQSWDEWSPEEDFCRFVGLLQRILQPAVTLETGVGVGRLTGHLDTELGTYLGFESDPAWRQPPAFPNADTPGREHMAGADLVILDSEPDHRFAEIALWAEVGKPGSVCVVHDCGNGHPAGVLHTQLGRTMEATGFPGLRLKNPRGGWMGWHS
jgi:hypothetical protein